MDLPLLDIAYEQKHTICGLLKQDFFSHNIVFLRFTHVAACINSTYLLMLNIPLYEGTTFQLSIHQLVEICFYFLAIMNNVPTNIGIQCLCGHVFNFLRYIYIGVELLSTAAIYLTI